MGWPQFFNFMSKNVFHHSSKGLSCLTVSVDYVSSGASNPDGSSAAPAVLTLGAQQSPSAGTWTPPEPCSWQFPAMYTSLFSLLHSSLALFFCSPTPSSEFNSCDAALTLLSDSCETDWHSCSTPRNPGRCLVVPYVKYSVVCMSSSPKEAACRRQFPSPVVARGSSFLQLVHMVDHQLRRPAHTHTHIYTTNKQHAITRMWNQTTEQ